MRASSTIQSYTTDTRRRAINLDKAIRTMCDTGRDMLGKYKETSLGGLAVNVPEC